LTYSLRDGGEVALLNSLAADKGYLRADLAADIKRALKVNESNAGFYGEYDTIKIFEIGNVFLKEGEFTTVCIGVHPLAMKKRSERANALLLLAKSKIEEVLGAHVDHRIDEETLEFRLTKDVIASVKPQPTLPIAAPGIKYHPLSPYPFVLRDIALWVHDGKSAEEIRAHIAREAGTWCVRCDLFDTFSKEGKTSYAYHLVFQSFEKTLTDDEVTTVMKKIESSLVAAGYVIR
jgi:phenylalanyl-tRNA synthetase beta subunit